LSPGRLKLTAAPALLGLAMITPSAGANDYASAKNGRIAFAGFGFSILTIGPLGESPSTVADGTTDPSFAPNGRRIAYSVENGAGNDPSVWVKKIDGSAIARLRREGRPWGFSPDGRQLLFGDISGSLKLMKLNGRGERTLVRGGPLADVYARDAEFSPDGEWVVFSSADGIGVVDRNGKRYRLLLSVPWRGVTFTDPTFAPDGKTIAFTRAELDPFYHSEIFKFRLGSAPVPLTADHAYDSSDPDFSPNGRSIVFERHGPAGASNSGDRIWTMTAAGADLRIIPGIPRDYAIDPSWGGSFRCAGRLATIVGDDGSDKIRGTSKADVIVGNAGRDRINGRGGKDRICGGDGPDHLKGDAGRDKLVGGPGRDSTRQ
jgi:WD40 repeat protein